MQIACANAQEQQVQAPPGHNGKSGTTNTAWKLESHRGCWRNVLGLFGPETAMFCKTQSAAQLSLKIPLYVLDNKAQNYSLY